MIRIFKKIKSVIYTFIAKIFLRDFSAKIRANGYTKLTRHTKVGNNVHFNGLRVLGVGNLQIGDNFHSGFGCKILTSYHNYESDSIPYDKTLIIKNVVIEENVWLGIEVIILPGVKIGEGAIIQAGSVVVSDIPKLAIAGGHPAKTFSYRNADRYYDLKSKNMTF